MSIELGGWSIDPSLCDYIRKILPDGSTILELGSGAGTEWLAEYYTMYSVEHNEKFVDKYKSTYFYCPLTKHKALRNHDGPMEWFDRDILKPALIALDGKYDLLLIDGPPGGTRCGIVKYIELFRSDVPIVLDDLHRQADRKIINSIASKLRKPYVTYGYLDGKPFGVINDPCLSCGDAINDKNS